METFVFSYQRGPHLDNFLRSARDCGWPGPVTVVDDGSTDPSTLEVLDRAERSGIAVVRRQHSQGGGAWGGLQASMDHALSLAQGPVTLFAQDDMQFVRPLRDGELERIAEVVNDPDRSPFLFPAFHVRTWKASRSARNFEPDDAIVMPRRTLFHPGVGFSDVSVLAPDRLREKGWDFRFEERGSSVLAYRLFGPMTSYPYPFLSFVPFPSVPRRGWRFALRNPRRLGPPARLRTMDADEVDRLFARDPMLLPFTSDHLAIEPRARRLVVGRAKWEF